MNGLTKPGGHPAPRPLAMVAVPLWLAAWQWSSPLVDCLVGAVFLLGIWSMLTASAYEWALLRRLGFIAHYLRTDGLLARWLMRRTLLLLWNALKNLPAALLLFTAALSLNRAEWLILSADVLFMALVLGLTSRLLDREAAERYARPLARVWAHRINALALWAALVTLSFFSPHPDYRGLSWEPVARAAAGQVDAGCDVVETLGRLDAVGEALTWWAAQNFIGGLTDTGELMVAWLAFIGAFGVSLVLAWSYSRALTGMMSRAWRLDSANPDSEHQGPDQPPR